MKLNLPDVTLICADCAFMDRSIASIERCKKLCDFGAIKFLTDADIDYPHRIPIRKLTSEVDYSVWVLKEIHTFIDTSHMLIVQHDGWILNAETWNNDWLNYAYMGPLYRQPHKIDKYSVGSGGFSLRSKALMECMSKKLPAWNNTTEAGLSLQTIIGCYEDGFISVGHREALEKAGFKFPSPEEASVFAQGGQRDPKYYVSRPFGFHAGGQNINFETGFAEQTYF